ncbi:pilus assembly protein [Acinetobacter baumannii]|uniref:pilus assembly protein n=1 Tax=Acinetobacter baumannii TaxID=470 RepID=UPI002958D9AD|nr:PilC/PilY family type IV pilus protein [Acinetobacter baumannii]WNX71003.1 PilC/PilY family type IV pilus protein [Acinetobacter baumannii]
MMNLKKRKLLSVMVSTLMACSSVSVFASDIDIYKIPRASKITLFLMFDTSGSMGSGDNYTDLNSRNSASSLYQDYNICPWSNIGSSRYPNYVSDVNVESKTYQVRGGTQKTYNVNYCNVSNTTYNNLATLYKNRILNECVKTSSTSDSYRCYDRLSRLKIALTQILSSDELPDTTRIGLGQFSSPTSTSTYSHDGKSGRVIYPVVALTQANREKLIDIVTRLSAYNGTPSAAAYGEAGAYFLGANTYGLTNSGYSYSVTTAKNNNNGYTAPLSASERADTCNGQGIYFLTDGVANSSTSSYTSAIMNKSIPLSGTGLSGGGSDAGWAEIGKFSKLLRGTNYNIKTAVVGFGSDFPNSSTYVKDLPVDILDQDGDVVESVNRRFYDCSALPDGDIKNTCNWGAKPHAQLSSSVGGFGNGGFYSAQSTQDVINSIKYFVDDIRPRFKPVLTGSPTLPQDALNPLRIQPYAYYASFTPKPQDPTQLWVGNMNKYNVLNGQLYADDKSTKLFNTDGSLNQSANGSWTGGVSGKLPLGSKLDTSNIRVANRTIYTNRKITGSAPPYTVIEDASLNKVSLQNLFADLSASALFQNDPAKNYWLNLLGYNVGEKETVTLDDVIKKPELRQVGAIMHSTPILLTQEGKVTISNGQLNTTDRKDYLLFGTTQGLLHVVDATTGKEIFAFVPNEMMQNQPKAFLSESSSSGGSSNLYYGIDAPWTAHTQYVAKADGTLTVNDSGRTVTDSTSGDEIALKGLQWVYGGLRMGGRSYYALDLSDLTNPKLKFHINPDGAINADKTPNTDNALSYMGQSWSKPTIAYVNFGGKKKLVMFVGGGYDAGYENPAYDQTNNKGAGVYMFDANNGDLLWWSSANASADKGAQAHTENSDLKYSVVSQINAVDRDSDGLVDHLYFGDLGGQAFRIDLNNNATGDNAAAKKGNFVTHVVRLLNQHVNNDGTSPRFYEMPSFSVHHADSGLLGVVALSSGNRSSPLSGVVGTNNPTPSTSASDGVFVIFDKDVANANLYSLADAVLKTKDVALASLNAYFTNKFTGDAYKNGVDIATKNGWKYTYSDSAGVYKGMNGLYALDGMLYVNVFYRDGDGIGGSCGAGVKGNSKLYQFCLPTGKCSFYGSSTTQPNNTDLGAGILGTALGNATSNNGQTLLQNVVKKTDNFCTDANKNSPECQLFNTTAKLQNLRWYETR